MTGPEHYREAERILAEVGDMKTAMLEIAQDVGHERAELEELNAASIAAGALLAQAQVHATLALVAVQGDCEIGPYTGHGRAWIEALS